MGEYVELPDYPSHPLPQPGLVPVGAGTRPVPDPKARMMTWIVFFSVAEFAEAICLPDYPSHHLPQCFIGLPSFAEALAEPSHGRVGASDATEEAICQRYHGMSREEWDAVPDEGWDSP